MKIKERSDKNECCLNCKTPEGTHIYCKHRPEAEAVEGFDETGELDACEYYTDTNEPLTTDPNATVENAMPETIPNGLDGKSSRTTSLIKLALNLTSPIRATVNNTSPLRIASSMAMLVPDHHRISCPSVEVVARSESYPISDFLKEDGTLLIMGGQEFKSESLTKILAELIFKIIEEEESLLKLQPKGEPIYTGIINDYEVVPALSEDGLTLQFITFTLIAVSTKPFDKRPDTRPGISTDAPINSSDEPMSDKDGAEEPMTEEKFKSLRKDESKPQDVSDGEPV